MSEETLDFSNGEFKQLLNQSSELVLRQFENIHNQKGYNDHPQKEVEQWFDEELPEEGLDPSKLLDEVETKVLNTATGNLGPHMYAYVMSGGNQMAIIAEKLANTINQNQTKWHLAPAMNEIEKRVIRWTAQMLGFPMDSGGVLVSGGSAANLTGLTVGRNVFFEKEGIRKTGLFGMKPFVVYASEEVHSCVDKSVELLGIGTNHLRKITTNASFQIDLEKLENQIKVDLAQGLQPFCIIGNAGTVNTGAIDDLESLSKLAKQYDMWFHVDGAYGALAALLDDLKLEYKGMELADSIAIDFHKWLYQPFEGGCTLVRNWDNLRRTYYKKAAYLDTELANDGNRLEYNEHYFQLSRNAKAFKVWMSIKAYGMKRLRAMIQKDIDLTDYLNEQVKKSEDFELVADSKLAVSCFRYVGNMESKEEIVQFNRLLMPELEKDGRVFIMGTQLKGDYAIRACFINHRKSEETTDYLLQVIREVAEKMIVQKKQLIA
ncbi:pyridoxal phosphate-dependent decarboxylase family protein [Flagellimonas meridianipacifica]|uniref:Glutamate/tyrosine decarboxylase-like PLP-dependent enzyme n=1 Tax=Flagellimonas meridianipacifica TaxID=1080225 RepID=A0A2T0M8U6_9FLAO|nr:pyridoxal-dependent decarboxylase [Allomuricauda pacifica]PRX53893.1 glutamate/tyrosine decarboxylase-like PLP-dependent enzyme [Allomuricauda pacifica]